VQQSLGHQARCFGEAEPGSWTASSGRCSSSLVAVVELQMRQLVGLAAGAEECKLRRRLLAHWQ
jgi:hypothetical protein